ncbi:alcohol dehydrogenase catalytic domain-containing protein, partial [Escherichia coli]|uniref:alcohol dehydrogenase catalytic domain-containing protein n=1 Tax=Escherichia coli TaxID=562 RepID=UPI0024E057A2
MDKEYICRSESIRKIHYPPPSLPRGLGTEAAGSVSKVGSGVKHIKAGDRVVYAQ